MIIRLLNERINYLPLFYGFIFVLGGICAIHEKKIRSWLQCHFTSGLGIFLLSCAVLVWKFREYVLAGIPLEDIPAKYMTQLTPEGLLYTVCWLLFFSAALEKLEDCTPDMETRCTDSAGTAESSPEAKRTLPGRALDVLSGYSMIIYLIHPLFLYYWLQWFELLGFSIAQVPVLVFYVLVLLTSLLTGMLIHRFAKNCRPVGLALLGRQPK